MGILYLICRFITLFFVIFLGDWIERAKIIKDREIVGIFDNLIHGFISLIILFPLSNKIGLKPSLFLLVAFLLGSCLDIDHFIVARTVYIKDVVHLSLRPYTHSITFSLGIALAVWLLTKSPVWGITVFVGLSSHILRDASNGITPILWPLHIYKIPIGLYLGGEATLFIIITLFTIH
jgi:hypothetical protein